VNTSLVDSVPITQKRKAVADPNPKAIVRLNTEVYKSLEKQLPPCVVTERTTEHYAGYLLGIQHVLKLLREGYTVG
jgi:hypothetical protein